VSALNGVLAQRLVRQLCQHCSQADAPDVATRARLGRWADRLAERSAADTAPTPPWSGWRRAVGCAQCRGTGYRGRRAVAELLPLDDALRDLIVARAPLAQLKQAARLAGLVSVREAVLTLVADGLTTLDEADRVTGDD
jgi:general secretion pathway protein E